MRSLIYSISLFFLAACQPVIGDEKVYEEPPLSIQPSTLNEEWAVEWWLPRHKQKLMDKTQQDVNLVFIGDSITHGWEGEGLEIWNKSFAQYGAFNLGFGGDRTENVLWRLQNGALDGLSPKLIVLMIGTNNTGHRMDTPADTIIGIQAILKDLEMRLPETKVLLLGIFPRGATPNDPARRRNEEINMLLKSMPKKDHIHYRDIGKIFTRKNGDISEDIMPDLLHLSLQGYGLWANAIDKDVANLMDE